MILLPQRWYPMSAMNIRTSFVWRSPKKHSPVQSSRSLNRGNYFHVYQRTIREEPCTKQRKTQFRISQPSLALKDLLCRRDPVERVHPGTAKILRAQIRAWRALSNAKHVG